MSSIDFRPHPLLRGGHVQTLAGVLWRGETCVERAILHQVEQPDGDRLVLHDDCPAGWRAGVPAALLVHGLAGCHRSPYMQRIARRLNERGMRTFRMDLRGCGAGLPLARFPYHSGRSEDALAAVRSIMGLCPGSPLALVGFSLGGNIVLKLLGEAPDLVPGEVALGIAVCPPVDLQECVQALGRWDNRWYDRHFCRLLCQQIAARQRLVPHIALPPSWPVVTTEPQGHGIASAGKHPIGWRPPRGIAEFDRVFTAPVCGFGTAENYYQQCSSAQFLPSIRVPTHILAAADDPLVPYSALTRANPSSAVRVQVARHGGHLGFLGRGSDPAKRRWMDWRVVEWVTAIC
ncbi:MAG: YheT family hydrolase [Planctomycetales bacterium]